MDLTELQQENARLQSQLEVFTIAIRQQKIALEEADARNGELADIVNHLSEKLRERDELIQQQEAELHALRSQLLTNVPTTGTTIKKVQSSGEVNR